MRIVFMGATELGWKCCRKLLDLGQDVVGIFSIPRQFRISWSPGLVTNVQHKSFEELAETSSIPLVFVTGKMGDAENVDTLRAMRPDLIIVAGWYYILPRSLRNIARLGAAGLHASLLPKYRGGAPLVWAMIKAEAETGVTFFHFADGIDDGDIIGQSKFTIDIDDDIATLVEKASQASVELIEHHVPRLAAGTATRAAQNEELATFVPQRKPEDGLTNWPELSARQAYDWVRAQTRPYPGAFTFLEEEKITIWKSIQSDRTPANDLPPGSIVIDAANSLKVCCSRGEWLEIRELGVAEQSVVSPAEFISSRKLQTGMKFQAQKRTCGVTTNG